MKKVTLRSGNQVDLDRLKDDSKYVLEELARMKDQIEGNRKLKEAKDSDNLYVGLELDSAGNPVELAADQAAALNLVNESMKANVKPGDSTCGPEVLKNLMYNPENIGRLFNDLEKKIMSLEARIVTLEP